MSDDAHSDTPKARPDRERIMMIDKQDVQVIESQEVSDYADDA